LNSDESGTFDDRTPDGGESESAKPTSITALTTTATLLMILMLNT
jgi:hypothetical protein